MAVRLTQLSADPTPPPAALRHPRKLQALEGLRGLAALYVAAGHFAIVRLHLERGKAALFFQFGQEAVMLFFLLSGFVIFYSVRNKPNISAREYFSRRFLRIYPIFILSLVCSHFVAGGSGNVLANLFMLQDFSSGKPGTWFSAYGNNWSLWSLSYEWWFYCMFFPLYRFVQPERRQDLVIAGSAVAAVAYAAVPNQISLFLMYFSIWWAGVELARTYSMKQRPTLLNQRKSCAALLVLAIYFGVWILVDKRRHVPLSFGIHPILEARHLLTALLVLVAACVLRAKGWIVVKRVLEPFAVVAPISYALYVLHLPLLVEAHYLDSSLGTLSPLVYLVVLVAASYLAEVPLQRLINQIAQPILHQEGANVPSSEVATRP